MGSSQFIRKSLFGLKIAITMMIFYLLLRHSQLKFDLLYPLIFRPVPLLVIIVLCYLMVLLHAWRWYRLNLTQKIDLSFLATIMPTYLGIAFNTVLPGSVGGDFVRLFYVMKNFPTQKSAALLAILVDRMTGLMGVFMIACLITPYYLYQFRHDDTLFSLLTGCVIVGACCMALFLGVSLLLSERIGIARRLKAKMPHLKWISLLSPLLEAVYVYRNAKTVIFETLIVSMITQMLLLLVVMMLCSIMELPMLSPIDFMLALVIGQVANLIPLTPGGVGLGEAAFANIILLLHPGTVAAYATVFFALRLLSTVAYLPGVLIGIFGFHLLEKKQVLSTTA